MALDTILLRHLIEDLMAIIESDYHHDDFENRTGGTNGAVDARLMKLEPEIFALARELGIVGELKLSENGITTSGPWEYESGQIVAHLPPEQGGPVVVAWAPISFDPSIEFTLEGDKRMVLLAPDMFELLGKIYERMTVDPAMTADTEDEIFVLLRRIKEGI